jgi:hypothetical protein
VNFKKLLKYLRANSTSPPKKQIFLNNNNPADPLVDSLITPTAQINERSKIPATKFLGVLFDPKLTLKPTSEQ